MFRRLSSSLKTFKTLEFDEGLNILVADKTQTSSDTDTRNGAGKSSLAELLHFLLGGRVDKNSLTMKPQLSGYTFSLDARLAFGGRSGHLTVSRRGAARDKLSFSSPITSR